MNRQDLINLVADDTGRTREETRRTVVALFDTLTDALAEHQDVRIADIGTFGVRLRKGRQMNGPIGNGQVSPDKLVPVFRPAKGLKERVDR